MTDNVTPVLLKTDVTFVEIRQKIIYYGVGNNLIISGLYSKEPPIIIQVFDKNTVISDTQFSANGKKFVAVCQNALVLFNYNENERKYERLSFYYYHKDWILSVKWINNDSEIAGVSMHNELCMWDLTLKKLKHVTCEDKCILYSAKIINRTWKDLIILSGTGFNEVVIWCPLNNTSNSVCPVLIRLQGHQGVIFSIDFNSSLSLICSTSDDRTSKIWEVKLQDLVSNKIKSNTTRLKFTLYGHTARVFRCKLLDKFIITAGEDALVNVWDLFGNNVKKFKTQEGNCIWALNCDEEQQNLAVGGSDGSVIVFPLYDSLNTDLLTIKSSGTPLKVSVLCSNNLATFSDTGDLNYYDFSSKKWTLVGQHQDLRKYVLMNVSKCRKLLSLSGFNGNIYIYEESNNSLSHIFFHKIPDQGRIYSFHWINCTSFVCCSTNGTLSLWQLIKNEKKTCILRSMFKLPKSQERWSTAACSRPPNHLIVGDRKGNIYLYSLDQLFPLQTIKKAHNYLGINDILCSGSEVITLGGNGVVKTYLFDFEGENLTEICSDKLPMSSLEKYTKCDSLVLVSAFMGDVFTIWDHENRRIVTEVKCGGKHRSWDMSVLQNTLTFCFIKNDSIYIHKTSLSATLPKEIVSHFHSKEINTCKVIVNNNKYIVISGGEDTTLRLSIGCVESGTFHTIQTCKAHLSSIRCICVVEVTKSTEKFRKFLVFSAGGRTQIITWTLQVPTDESKIELRQLHTYYEPTDTEHESETRVMDMCTIKRDSQVFLLAACSDGSLLVFLNDFQGAPRLLQRVFYDKYKCITKILHMEPNDVLIIAMTSGEVLFVDLRLLLSVSGQYEAFKVIRAHQNAINSIYIRKLNDTDIILLTGGDDNSIRTFLIHLNSNGLDINVVANTTDNSQHCAQITGIYCTEKYLFSVSIDQKLIKYDINIYNGNIHVKMIECIYTSVSDVQGMQTFHYQNNFYNLCYGRGIELLKI